MSETAKQRDNMTFAYLVIFWDPTHGYLPQIKLFGERIIMLMVFLRPPNGTNNKHE